MIERLLELRVQVYSGIFDDLVTRPSDRNILDIRDSFWKIMEDICPVLELLADVTKILGREDLPTGSSVYVLIHNLISDILKESDCDSEVAKQLKPKIRNGLMKRFKVDDAGIPNDDIVTSPLVISTLLVPRYESKIGRDILPVEKRDMLYAKLKLLMDECNHSVASSGSVPDTIAFESGVVKKKPKIWNVIQGETDQTCETNITTEVELKRYLDESVSVSQPLTWWKLHQFKFPRLAMLAKKYLASNATSVPSERAFSTAGLKVTKLRSSLDSDTVDELIFINRNYKSNDLLPQPTSKLSPDELI